MGPVKPTPSAAVKGGEGKENTGSLYGSNDLCNRDFRGQPIRTLPGISETFGSHLGFVKRRGAPQP